MLLSGGVPAVGSPHCILVIIVLHPILTQSHVGEAARPDHVWIRRWGTKLLAFCFCTVLNQLRENFVTFRRASWSIRGFQESFVEHKNYVSRSFSRVCR